MSPKKILSIVPDQSGRAQDDIEKLQILRGCEGLAAGDEEAEIGGECRHPFPLIFFCHNNNGLPESFDVA